VVAIAAGGWHSLAVKADGTVWAWGYNGNSELGDGTTTQRAAPVQVGGSLAGVTKVAAGRYHSLALKADGTVKAWGFNGDGELGDGTTTNRTTPVSTNTLADVAVLAAGEWHSVAAKADGSVWTWGYNGDGQLGDGTFTTRTSPVQTGSGTLTGAVAVAAGSLHGLAAQADGTVWGWGSSFDGQVGNGTLGITRTPVQAGGGLAGMGGVAAGAWHSLAAFSRRAATTYAYDALSRLTSERQPGLLTTYAYDPVGNRTAVTRAGTTTSRTYDKADRGALAEGYHYDANGNLTVRTGYALSYDAADRPTGAAVPGYALSFTYDGDGKRASLGRQVAGGGAAYTATTVYDVSQGLPVVLADTVSGASAPPSRKYVWGAAGLAYAVGSDGSVAVYHADGLGSVRALTDGSGSVVQTYRTDAFGVPVAGGAQGSVSQRLQYAGEERDGDALVFLRARTDDS
jgi:YD repeat-containing protein